MLDAYIPTDHDDGPKMIGPHNTHYGREVSQVEQRAIDMAAMEYVSSLRASGNTPVHVLDLGCGTGHTAEAFARMGCHVTAVDVRDSHDDIAQRNAGLLNDRLKPIEFINDDLYKLDFTELDKPWDVIILNRVFHFLPSKTVAQIMTQLVEQSPPNTHFVINFRSSDHRTGLDAGRTFIESDEDGCLPTYYLHNSKLFMETLAKLGCSVELHEKHDLLCLLFVKNSSHSNALRPTLAPSALTGRTAQAAHQMNVIPNP